ncbi:MAG: Hsp20/alpha crystallin family protein [Deltaproteobacteria bacterium]|nr:Hsp20/alpha crystallin family protein [Deltaproteobacteria bacterium]
MTLLIKKNQKGAASTVPSLFESFDRLFDGFVWPTQNRTEGFWSPAIDVKETDKEFVVEADLPGLEEKDVRVELNENSLTVSGERKQEKEEKTEHYYRSERSFGKFTRSMALNTEIKENEVKATFKNGTLRIVLPKAKVSKLHGKIIPIQK